MDHALTAFFIHSSLVESVFLEATIALLERQGFTHLDRLLLTEDHRNRLQKVVGDQVFGNGVRDCGIAFIGLDLSPQEMEPHLKQEYPHVDNGRLLWRYYQHRIIRILQKYCRQHATPGTYATLRDLLETDTPFRAIRFTCNTDAAWKVIEEIAPDRIPDLRQKIQNNLGAFQPPFPVVRELRRGGRGRTDIVRYDGMLAVCKTFRPGAEQFMQNELNGLRLSEHIPEIPPPLATGKRWVVIPYYEDAILLSETRPFRHGLIPLRYVRHAFDVLRRIHEHGYALIDFHAGNVLIDPIHGMKVIDFEFLHEYRRTPPPFEDSPAITGVFSNGKVATTRSFEEQRVLPPGEPGHRSFDEFWHSLIGVKVDDLLHGPRWKQRLKWTWYLFHNRLRVSLGEQRRNAQKFIRRVFSTLRRSSKKRAGQPG